MRPRATRRAATSPPTKTRATWAPGDASFDAGDVQVPFCASYADAGATTFCQDFDSISDAAVLAPVVSPTGQFQLDTTDYASSPHSLRVTIASSDSGAALHAVAQGGVSVAPSTVTVDFDMKVSSTAATATANIATLKFSSQRELLLAITSNGFFLEENTPAADGGTGGLSNHAVVGFAWNAAWHHFTIAISFIQRTSVIMVDGTTYENDLLLGNWTTVGMATLEYGISYTPAGLWTIGQDNILLRVTP